MSRFSQLYVTPHASAVIKLVPAVVLLLALVGVPLLGIAIASLSSGDGDQLSFALTLANYWKFATTGHPPIYLLILVRTLAIAISVTALTLLISYPAAYFIAFYGGGSKYILLLAITLPFWTSYLLRVFSWKIILGHDGLLNSGLMALGLMHSPSDVFLYNAFSVVIALTHAWVPFAIMPLFVSLEKVDRSLIEAAADLGLGPLSIFRRVILPLSLPGIAAAGCLVFVPTVGDYVTASQVGGSSGLMIGNVVQSLFGRADNPALGSAVSIATMAAATLVVVLAMRLFGRSAREGYA